MNNLSEWIRTDDEWIKWIHSLHEWIKNKMVSGIITFTA